MAAKCVVNDWVEERRKRQEAERRLHPFAEGLVRAFDSHTRPSAAGLVTCLVALVAGCGADPDQRGFLSGTWTGEMDITMHGGPAGPQSPSSRSGIWSSQGP